MFARVHRTVAGAVARSAPRVVGASCNARSGGQQAALSSAAMAVGGGGRGRGSSSRLAPSPKSATLLQARRTVFINTETTPNPQSMKFLPGQEVLPEAFGTGMFFQRGDFREIDRSPLAKAILTVTGVKSIFLGKDFITVTKNTDEAWNILKPQIFTKILDFLAEGKPVISDKPEVSDTTVLDTDDEVVATIKELLETRVRPAVQEDGGDIFYVGFDPVRGIVQVRLAGSCVGCPSSSITLRNGVENMLMHYIPEVKGIEEMGQLEEEGACSTHGKDDTAALEFKPNDVAKSTT